MPYRRSLPLFWLLWLLLFAMFSSRLMPAFAQKAQQKQQTNKSQQAQKTQETYPGLLAQTVQQFNDENMAKTAALAHKLISLDPKRYEGYYYLALVQFRYLNYSDAEASLKTGLARAPETKKEIVGKLLAQVQNTRTYEVALKEGQAAEQSGLRARAAQRFADAARALPSRTEIGLKAAQMLFDLGEPREAAILAALVRDAATEDNLRLQAALRVEEWRPLFFKEADAQFTVALRQLKAGESREAVQVLEQVAPLTQDRNEGLLALLAARFAADSRSRAVELVQQWIRSKPAHLEPLADTRVARYYGAEIVTRLFADPQIGMLLSDAFGAPALAQTIRLCSENKTEQEPASIYRTRINPKDGAEMVLIPAGKFPMGDSDIASNPRQTIRLNAYWIYTKPVTVAQYKKFCADTNRNMPPAPLFNSNWSKEDHPIVNVLWEDAADYAAWAGVRLPTETEWEKAARGIEGNRFPWGNEFDDISLWGSVNEKRAGTVPVGSYVKGASPYGVLDMAGNVWQWCADSVALKSKPNQPKGTPSPNAQKPVAGLLRILRGGSWSDGDQALFRTSYRNWLRHDTRDNTNGFRCAAPP